MLLHLETLLMLKMYPLHIEETQASTTYVTRELEVKLVDC